MLTLSSHTWQVWNVVKAVMPSNGPGLTRSQFSGAMRLVALAQSGQELSDDQCGSALDPMASSLRFGGLLPPPNLRSRLGSPSPASRWVRLRLRPEH